MYVLRYNPATDRTHECWVIARVKGAVWESLAGGPTANAAFADLQSVHGLTLLPIAGHTPLDALRIGGVRADVELVPA